MKIAIDCRALRKSPSGIPNFLVAAINGIVFNNPAWDLYLLSNEEFNKDLNERLVKSGNLHIIIDPLPIFNGISFLWFLFKIRDIVKQIKPDLFWAPAFLLPPLPFLKVRTLVTVHDLVYQEHKNTMTFTNWLFFALLHNRSVKTANLIWSNSGYTKAGIEKYYPHRKCENIFVGFFINTQVFRRQNINQDQRSKLLFKYKITEKFLLFVGTLEPRKNLSFLLSLMPKLSEYGFTLLVVGAKGWGKSDINEIVSQPGFPRENVSFAGFVSTEELVQLYNLASVYVSTSFNEGFGMPQLEAMACGCPVISPHNSAMVEVVEGAGETIKSWDPQVWVDTINKVASDPVPYQKLGFKRLQDFEVTQITSRLTNYIAS